MERIIDIHCHSTMKPFGQSFASTPYGNNSNRTRNKNSVWFADPPNGLEAPSEKITGVVNFSQADFTTLIKGGVDVIVTCLYPLEKGFVRNTLGTGDTVDSLINYVNGTGEDFINYTQTTDSYFSDLQLEYKYLLQLHNKVVTIDGIKLKYVLINSLDEMADYEESGVKILFVLLSIEGGHVFDCGYPDAEKNVDEATVLKNVTTVKNWEYRPVFMGIAHHFYSGLCGHARSFSQKLIAWVLRQERGMNEGLNELGKKVLKLLLDNTDNNRILIDVKHLSVKSRIGYYEILDTAFKEETIPVIVSHGAVNGLHSFTDPVSRNNAHLRRSVLDTDINFFDEELIRIEKSNGIFGIQFDERRICSKNEGKKQNIIFGSLRKRKKAKSKLVWNQIQYIAELLDKKGLPAWDIQAIGSDFDGGINAINNFATANEFSELGSYLEYHAEKFMASNKDHLQPFNRLSPELIVDKFLGLNAEAFLNEVR